MTTSHLVAPHGEVDERSWRLKQSLLRRQSNTRKETKLFHEYARQALEDTLTLFLHGICCDIDVETGPRQLPSRHLRKRLNLMKSLYPPPQGYAVFPEDAEQAISKLNGTSVDGRTIQVERAKSPGAGGGERRGGGGGGGRGRW